MTKKKKSVTKSSPAFSIDQQGIHDMEENEERRRPQDAGEQDIPASTVRPAKKALVSVLLVIVFIGACLAACFAYIRPMNQQYTEEITQLKATISEYEKLLTASPSGGGHDVESEIAYYSELLNSRGSFSQRLAEINSTPGYWLIFVKATEESTGISRLNALADEYQEILKALEAQRQEGVNITAAYDEAVGIVLANLDGLSNAIPDIVATLSDQVDFYRDILTQIDEQIVLLDDINSRPDFSDSLHYISAASPEISQYTEIRPTIEALEGILADSDSIEKEINAIIIDYTSSDSAKQELLTNLISFNQELIQIIAERNFNVLFSQNSIDVYLSGLQIRDEYMKEMIEFYIDYAKQKSTMSSWDYAYSMFNSYWDGDGEDNANEAYWRNQLDEISAIWDVYAARANQHIKNAEEMRSEYREFLGYQEKNLFLSIYRRLSHATDPLHEMHENVR